MLRTCSFFTIIFVMGYHSTFAQDAIPKLERIELGNTKNVHTFGTIYLAGQPSADDFKTLADKGVKTVISLRQADETEWDQTVTLKELGMTFHRFDFQSPDSLTDDIFDKSLKLLNDQKGKPVLLHCASANRVGAIWLAHRVINDGLDVKAAQAEAKTVGLRTQGYEQKALAYLTKLKMNGDASVKPGINKTFLDPELDVSEWLGRFEIESREVYGAREKVLDEIGLQPGQRVADIGAGTGFYSRLFANEVGKTGWVFAVDISVPFLKHINTLSQENNVTNITSVLGSERSINLPPNSIDAAFICDTYHHFEYPQATLASIQRALKPGGTLIVIDFERIPGKSREWTLGHVRAGKEVFQKEITDAGFEFVEEVKIASFIENYFLKFRKK